MFRDRAQAGRALAGRLRRLAGPGCLVLGLPRGGVPVAAEVAAALGAPLDVLAVRKLGVPGSPEYAMGAIASGGARVLHEDTLERLGIRREDVAAVEARERRELDRRERAFRGGRPPPDARGKTVVLVDDGLATGATMTAAVRAARAAGAARVVVAVPVGDPEACAGLRLEADEVVCLERPEPFYAVGAAYEDFAQTSDEEVRALLDRG